EIADHVGVRQCQCRADIVAFRQTLGLFQCLKPSGSGHKIAFEVYVFRLPDGYLIEVLGSQKGAYAQEGIHRAVGVRRSHHKTFSRDPLRTVLVAKVRIHTVAPEVFKEELAKTVFRDETRIEGPATELAYGDHGITRRTSTCH